MTIFAYLASLKVYNYTHDLRSTLALSERCFAQYLHHVQLQLYLLVRLRLRTRLLGRCIILVHVTRILVLRSQI
jgi:hypothetical protein